MNTICKAALLAAVGLTSITTVKASSDYDLVLGFTEQGLNAGGNDFMVDIGPAVPVSGYSTGFSNGETWDLSSQLSTFNNLGDLYWGAIGDASTIDGDSSANLLWVTTGGLAPSILSGASAFNQAVNTPITAMETEFPNHPSNIGDTATPIAGTSSPDQNSWDQQTITGTGSSELVNSYGGINVNVTGETSDTLWQVTGDGSAPVAIGSFTLNSQGILTFNATPEPSILGLFSVAGGLAALACFNRLRRKQA